MKNDLGICSSHQLSKIPLGSGQNLIKKFTERLTDAFMIIFTILFIPKNHGFLFQEPFENLFNTLGVPPSPTILATIA